MISAGRIVERGAVVHLEKNNSFLEVNGEKTEIIFDGARAFIKAKVIAAVGEGDAMETDAEAGEEAEDPGGASASAAPPGASSA